MPKKLPKGWVETTLGEIAKPSRGRALPMEVPDMRYVGLEHIEPHTMRLLGSGYAREVRSSSVRFQTGDVLYGKMRPYLNKVWVAEFAGICSAEFLVFPKNDALNSQFLALLLNGAEFVTFANGLVSGERPRVDFKALSRFPFFLPPVAEQDRIIAKLNMVLTKMRRAEMAAQRAQERLKRYRAAVLHAAVTGKLTRTWRKTHKPDEAGTQFLQRLLKTRRARWEDAELQRIRHAGKQPKDVKWSSRYREPIAADIADKPKLPKCWIWMSLDQLAFHITSGSRAWSKYYDKGSGTFLMAQNVRRTGLDLSFRQAVDPPANDPNRERSQVAKNDILVTIVGSNTGDVCVVPKYLPEYFVCQSVALVRLAEPVFARFLWLYLAADEDGQRQWREMIYGAGRPHLGFKHLRITAVPVPPRAEQSEIVSEAEHRLAAADRLGATLNRQIDRARATRQSILREAFVGHLVPQDSNDKPASNLLERIAAIREAEAKNPEVNRMPKSKSKVARRPLLDVLREHKKPMTPEQLFRDAGFEPSQVDLFYRELASLRKTILEKKPSSLDAVAWPHRAHVLLELKEL